VTLNFPLTLNFPPSPRVLRAARVNRAACAWALRNIPHDGLSAEARLLFETLLSLSAIRDSCGAERPEVINSSACDTAVQKKQYYSFKVIKRMIELTPALKEFDAFGSLADDFWVRRNEEMIRNIVRYSKEFRGKRIVVLCGYEHRYYLGEKLKGQEPKENFVLREYWNY
jgi:hypothetical protein